MAKLSKKLTCSQVVELVRESDGSGYAPMCCCQCPNDSCYDSSVSACKRHGKLPEQLGGWGYEVCCGVQEWLVRKTDATTR